MLNLVERLNQGRHVEKIHYFMSKADEVESESDRQRVLIQITQNLATRIRNSHAFNLPTFYLPHDDGLPCTIRERRRRKGGGLQRARRGGPSG